MRNIFFVAVTCAVGGCSLLYPEGAYTKPSDLPPKFYLSCSAPRSAGNQLPEGTVDGFRVTVDLVARKFSVPWQKGQWPIKDVTGTELVFIDSYIERGLDNNPMEAKLRFNVPNGELVFRSIAYARMPLNRSFTASCKVVSDA